jgi:hypothetical protein
VSTDIDPPRPGAGIDVANDPAPEARAALWRVAFATMAAPGAVLRRHAASMPAPLALAVSGSAFALFFAQTAIDLHRGGPWDAAALVSLLLLVGSGAAIGSVGVGLLALLAFALSRPFAAEATLGWTLRAFGLAYSPTLVYALCGLLVQLLLGWPTAIAFGVTGYLWALGPLHAAIGELTGQRAWPSALLTTLIGAVLLLAWAIVGLGGLP